MISTTVLAVGLTTASAHSTTGVGANGKFLNPADTANWIFSPTTVLPQFGTSRPVTGSYSVTYFKNKVSVYLPYFGKAYAGADIYSGNSPLDFTSVNYTMEKQPAKKGGWTIILVPKDYSEVESMRFTFYDNGNATLDVTMRSRSPISFYGNVETGKRK